MTGWLHLDWFVVGALFGATVVAAFWVWVIDTRRR